MAPNQAKIVPCALSKRGLNGLGHARIRQAPFPHHRPDCGRRHVHGTAGRHGVGHRAAQHGARAGGCRPQPVHRPDLLSDQPGDLHSGVGALSRQLRRPHRVPYRHHRLHPGLHRLRPGAQRRFPGGGAILPGRGRGADAAGGAAGFDAQRGKARSDPGHLLGTDPCRDRAHPGAAGGRLHRHLSELALDILHQCPIGILGVILVSLFIANSRGEVPDKTDYKGMFLSSLSLGLLLFGFELTSHDGQLYRALILLAVGAALGSLYIRHARIIRDPILDISLMKIPTYGTSVIAGAITRVTQGAHPYLLPLMMQLGFGLSAAQSGLMTIGTAIGSIIAKPFAPTLLRRFGFRDTLMVNGVFASAGYAICGLFCPGWPLPVMFLVMAASGFFMSIQFTGYNTIAYDEIAQERMGSATSFYSTFQQLMLSMGICAGAAALQGAMVLRGHVLPHFADFTVAFWTVALISLSATIWNRRFSHEAGTEISGHTPRTWSTRQVIKEPRGLNS